MDGEKWPDICHSARPPLISGVYARQEKLLLDIVKGEENVCKATDKGAKDFNEKIINLTF